MSSHNSSQSSTSQTKASTFSRLASSCFIKTVLKTTQQLNLRHMTMTMTWPQPWLYALKMKLHWKWKCTANAKSNRLKMQFHGKCNDKCIKNVVKILWKCLYIKNANVMKIHYHWISNGTDKFHAIKCTKKINEL